MRLAGMAACTILAITIVWSVVRYMDSRNDAERVVLAINWQPAFCEMKPTRPECATQREGRFDTKNFSLHGVWPQPRGRYYCGVDNNTEELDRKGRWHRLPQLNLSDELYQELAKKMPGTASFLHRHEWFKHGTCMPGNITAGRYFKIALQLLDAVNSTNLNKLFRERTGQSITREDIRRAVASGNLMVGSSRIDVQCVLDGDRRLIKELRIEMPLSAAEPNPSHNAGSNLMDVTGCRSGIVDPVGNQ